MNGLKLVPHASNVLYLTVPVFLEIHHKKYIGRKFSIKLWKDIHLSVIPMTFHIDGMHFLNKKRNVYDCNLNILWNALKN